MAFLLFEKIGGWHGTDGRQGATRNVPPIKSIKRMRDQTQANNNRHWVSPNDVFDSRILGDWSRRKPPDWPERWQNGKLRNRSSRAFIHTSERKPLFACRPLSRTLPSPSSKIFRFFQNLIGVVYISFQLNCNKKAELSLKNPRDAKACQKLLQFDVLTKLSLTILVYLHSFSCCCVRNLRNCMCAFDWHKDRCGEILRNSLKIQTYRVQGHPKSSMFVSIESAHATSYES